MTLQISPEQMEQYKRAARIRWQRDQAEREARRQRSWELARQAALLLKKDFGAQRVVLFGSLIDSCRFTLWSDVDLAAWGLTSQNWLKAIGAVRDLSTEIELNLIDVECCSPQLLEVIEREGVPL
jgi:predicted nucleotidyltransferase